MHTNSNITNECSSECVCVKIFYDKWIVYKILNTFMKSTTSIFLWFISSSYSELISSDKTIMTK